MPTFNIKSRKHGAATLTNVDAANADAAIKAFVATAAAGEEYSVMSVSPGTGPTGITSNFSVTPAKPVGPTGCK